LYRNKLFDGTKEVTAFSFLCLEHAHLSALLDTADPLFSIHQVRSIKKAFSKVLVSARQFAAL